MSHKRITCDGEEFELVPVKPANVFPLQIAVLDRGFVYVGRIEKTVLGITIHEARNVRIYGTKNGLGSLASDGPTSNTVLDKCPNVIVPGRSIMHMIECAEEKWK